MHHGRLCRYHLRHSVDVGPDLAAALNSVALQRLSLHGWFHLVLSCLHCSNALATYEWYNSTIETSWRGGLNAIGIMV